MSRIIPEEWFKYDELGRYYYLTPTGAEKLTGIDTLTTDWKQPERRLKKQGLILKSIMSMSTNDNLLPRCSRKDFIEYTQYADEETRRNVFQLLSEFAEWSWDIDADRMTYEERNPYDVVTMMPITMKMIGHSSGLIYMGQTCFEVPEDEYQVGY